MSKYYTWDEYRLHLEKIYNKEYIGAIYEDLLSEEKWSKLTEKYKGLIIPKMKAMFPAFNHDVIWENTKDIFTKELLLYAWYKSKYRISKQHHLGYRDEDLERLIYDVIVAEGIECNFAKSEVLK